MYVPIPHFGNAFGASGVFFFFFPTFSFLRQPGLGGSLYVDGPKRCSRDMEGKLFRTSALIPHRNISRLEGVAADCGCESHRRRTSVSTYAAAAAPSRCTVSAAAASMSLDPPALQLFSRTIFGQG